MYHCFLPSPVPEELRKWDGNTYVLNNERFYTEDDNFLLRLLGRYHISHRYAIDEVYSFYIGLAFYYHGNVPMARAYLQWVVNHAEKQDYIQAAESLLKKLLDVTGDGVVNVLDLGAGANAFGKAEPDLNGDGVVNILDLVIVANAFSG